MSPLIYFLLYSNFQNEKGSTKRVTQYHFTSWPDNGVPEYAEFILSYYRRLQAHYVVSTGPILIHCRLEQTVAKSSVVVE